jgi:Mg/Co/Ni transporter MgtE
MLAEAMISDNIPPLKLSDSGTRAIDWMLEFKTTHLPLVDKGQYLGLITEDDIIDFNDPDESLQRYKDKLPKPFVRQRDHIYEVMRVAVQMRSPLIPVVDEEMNYLGLITTENLLQYFARISGMHEEGGIIVLRLPGLKEYTLSDIARLVESNNAHVLSTYMTQEAESQQIRLTIKVNTTEIQDILATFRRYEYEIEAFYQEEDMSNMYKDRFDSLMNYLNI